MMGPAQDPEEDEVEALTRIGEGLTSIRRQLPQLGALTGLRALNLHGNGLTCIDGLDRLPRLATLNLSSNSIARIDNLDSMGALTSLNLASNRLTDVHGLAGCSALTWLDLSYNELASLEGLSQLQGAPLARLDVRHNALRALQSFSVLAGLAALRQLRVAGNTGCYGPAAFAALRQALPQVRCGAWSHSRLHGLHLPPHMRAAPH